MAATSDAEQQNVLEAKFSEFLQVFLSQETPDGQTVAQARELIPQLVRMLIVVDNPTRDIAIPILDWCDYLTESVPECHGDGDPKVVGPIVVQLLQSFTRSGVSAEIMRKIAAVAGKLLGLLAGHDTAALGLLCSELVAATGDLIDIASQWHTHRPQHSAAAAGGGTETTPVFLVFLDQCGRSMCGETEILRVEVSSAEQAWEGVRMVLQCRSQHVSAMSF